MKWITFEIIFQSSKQYPNEMVFKFLFFLFIKWNNRLHVCALETNEMLCMLQLNLFMPSCIYHSVGAIKSYTFVETITIIIKMWEHFVEVHNHLDEYYNLWPISVRWNQLLVRQTNILHDDKLSTMSSVKLSNSKREEICR